MQTDKIYFFPIKIDVYIVLYRHNMDKNSERTRKFKILAADNGYKFKEDVIVTTIREKIISICPNNHEYSTNFENHLQKLQID